MLLMTTVVDWLNSTAGTEITEVVDVAIAEKFEIKKVRQGFSKIDCIEPTGQYEVKFTDSRNRVLVMDVTKEDAEYIREQIFETGKIDLRTTGRSAYTWSYGHSVEDSQ